jgi:hypothetical protein
MLEFLKVRQPGCYSRDVLRVRIVCYENVHDWILGKFALRLYEGLKKCDVDVHIAKVPDSAAHINHHVHYWYYDGRKTTTDTVMITHIDSAQKLAQLKSQLLSAPLGICMSRDTLNQLAGQGISRGQLVYISPGHDGHFRPRKLLVGITSKVQPTGCKREYLIEELIDAISPDIFKFIIMGSGWETIVSRFRTAGFEIEYYSRFNHKLYARIIPALDFYLYPGWDEGSMGFLDAVAAGVQTIVTPQGFHLDAAAGITYAFNSIHELKEVFRVIADRRKSIVNPVVRWTWDEYARKHLMVWRWLLHRKGILEVEDIEGLDARVRQMAMDSSDGEPCCS